MLCSLTHVCTAIQRVSYLRAGRAGERYLKDVIWRVRTPSDARAALAVTELFTQHRAARQQLRPYKKYVSEKLIEVRTPHHKSDLETRLSVQHKLERYNTLCRCSYVISPRPSTRVPVPGGAEGAQGLRAGGGHAGDRPRGRAGAGGKEFFLSFRGAGFY